MEIQKVVVGQLKTNCYILKKGNECLIIDPGDEVEKIKKEIGQLKVIGILITHYHFDHIGALDLLKQLYQVPVYDFYNLKEGNNQLGSFKFEVIYTPGHKEDSISFLFDQMELFVGDFIFKGSIGRTDLPGGNITKMLESIQKIKQYPDFINVHPGHGLRTNLKEEKECNYYF